MIMKLKSDDDEKTLLMNVWMSVYLEGGCTLSAIEKADNAIKEFSMRFLETKSE